MSCGAVLVVMGLGCGSAGWVGGGGLVGALGLVFRLVCISCDLDCFVGVGWGGCCGWFDFDWIFGRFRAV